MPWDAFQREMLEAMGHAVYAPRAQSAPGAAPAATATGLPAPVPRGLLQALARAAGVAPESLPPLPPAEHLRTPSGKRALWPVLRRMRRATR